MSKWSAAAIKRLNCHKRKKGGSSRWMPRPPRSIASSNETCPRRCACLHRTKTRRVAASRGLAADVTGKATIKICLVFKLLLILFVRVDSPEVLLVYPFGPTASLCFATFAEMTTKTTRKKTTKKTTTTDEEE